VVSRGVSGKFHQLLIGVEVAFLPDAVAVRDTKDRALPLHRYPAARWSEFLSGVRSGEFERP
jgi:hypothetical protein